MNEPIVHPGVVTAPLPEPDKRYWRSLAERASGSADEFVQRAFPELDADGPDPITRRRFLTLLGASLALAGASGCTRPPGEKIHPYIRQPGGMVPGRPSFYATAMPMEGSGIGLLVESHEGRPTKVEGNPDHPASLGATDLFAQASILALYDPDRSRSVTHLGQPDTWGNATQALRAALDKQRAKKGAGLRLLTESIASPTSYWQIQTLLQAFPEARRHQFEPISLNAAREGIQLALGTDLNVYYDFSKADVILSLDADFLAEGPGHLRYVRDFTDRRRVRGNNLEMNRLYAVDATPTLTGAAADHRLCIRPSELPVLARELASRLGVIPGGPGADRFGGWNLAALAEDLKRHRGKSLILAGHTQPVAVHALAHAMNEALGNFHKTVLFTDSLESDLVDGNRGATAGTLRELLDDMRNGRVSTLVILGGNPAFTAPADIEFASALLDLSRHADALTVHLSTYDDETSQRCQWHLPETHFLETWSDTRAFDGTATIMQPLIAPLYHARSSHEILAILESGMERAGHDLVKDNWRRFWEKRIKSGDFERFWQRSLHEGVVEGTKLPLKAGLSLRKDWAKSLGESRPSDGLEIVFRPDPTIYDGRFANNAWLQELPKPLTRLTWDNAILIGPTTAARLGMHHEPGQDGGGTGWRGGERGEVIAPLVRLRSRGREVVAPAWIMPGQPDGVVTVHLGYGRSQAGKTGTGTGFDFYPLRTSENLWSDSGVTIELTNREFVLACTQQHFLMENRGLVRSATLEEYRGNRHFAEEKGEGKVPLTLYPEFDYSPPKHRWGMAIDLTACVGCGACVVACQAENNIPVVGKTEVSHGREMHWLRIDRYYEGAIENPRTYFEPVPCMQCENAPCELPCPVGATVHSEDGLNDMVYNRCVGTRYCSNNCPYKVRRFNFLHYADYSTESLKLAHNPEVTVRSRGVMEKCTYCVQRIRGAEIEDEKRVAAGQPRSRMEFQTACQQACPARAIIFGDTNETASEVQKMKNEPRNYALLADLNARPRTTYLAALNNPNPELEAAT